MKKSEFEYELKALVNSSAMATKLTRPFATELLAQLKETESPWKTKANRPTAHLRIHWMQVGPRRVKTLHLVEEDGTRIPLPRGKLIAHFFPPVQRKSREKTSGEHKWQSARVALRLAIDPQIHGRRDNLTFPIRCPHTLKWLYHAGEVALDHTVPFVELVDMWLTEEDLYISDLTIKGRGNNKVLADDKLQQSWEDFHRTHAHLQPVDRKWNLAAGSKGYKLKRLDREASPTDSIDLDF